MFWGVLALSWVLYWKRYVLAPDDVLFSAFLLKIWIVKIRIWSLNTLKKETCPRLWTLDSYPAYIQECQMPVSPATIYDSAFCFCINTLSCFYIGLDGGTTAHNRGHRHSKLLEVFQVLNFFWYFDSERAKSVSENKGSKRVFKFFIFIALTLNTMFSAEYGTIYISICLQ